MVKGYYKRVSQRAQKLSREQLLVLVEELAGENDKLDSIIESISAGILIFDENFLLQQTNAIVEGRLPFIMSADEARTLRLPAWKLIDDEEISAFFKRCYDNDITNCNEDFSVRTPGGSVRFVTITMTPLVNDGRLSGRIVLVRDVTEKKTQDVLLRRMENLANLTNLAAGMAHEIKNPLGAIGIHIQLIQKALAKARENSGILPQKKFVEDHIDVVNEEIDHLNRLVMDFLFAVRPIKATLELKDPKPIIMNIVNFFTPEFNRCSVDIEYVATEKDVRIMIDEKLFREVIINLAQNSLAAIKSRFEACNQERREGDTSPFTGHFVLESSATSSKYFIKISDNGSGMSGETLEKIFEPYYTTKANGTGLGMTMAYKVIKEFSGDIQVESELGKGSSFIISFPLPQKDKRLIGQAGE